MALQNRTQVQPAPHIEPFGSIDVADVATALREIDNPAIALQRRLIRELGSQTLSSKATPQPPSRLNRSF